MSLSSLLSDLSGRSSKRFVVLLLAAVDKASEGAALVERAASGDLTAAQAYDLMYDVEHQGDELRRQLVVLMNRSLITPIDREDLNRLSNSIDTVLDTLRDCLSLWREFEMGESPVILPLAVVIVAALVRLRTAVEIVVESPGSIASMSLDAKKTGINSVRKTHDVQLAALYKMPEADYPRPLLDQTRDLLRRLDVVGLRLTESADYLADAAVKRAEG